MPSEVRVGTRGSPLALTQTRAFVARLAERWPATRFTLEPIDTRGDKNREVALSKVDDALFFSAELDEALLEGRVDLCIHSLKDLPEARPFHSVLPEREDPRDVVLVRRDAVGKLNGSSNTPFRLGTSTSRRAANVIDFIDYIFNENVGQEHSRVELRDIRGNIDQRLRQLVEPNSRYDGIVLALAGLNRLWSNPEARPGLAGMLDQLRWMVLPLERCPTAAGQGVLSVECRSDDSSVKQLLAPFVKADIQAEVDLERRLMDAVAPESRGTFGATAQHASRLGLIAWVRGHVTADGSESARERLVWTPPAKPIGAKGWEGARWSSATRVERLRGDPELWAASAVFVAHSRAIPDSPPAADARVWAAGLATWKALARRGVWVEGCAEVLGFEALKATLESPVLQLPELAAWRVLTHAGAADSWGDLGIRDVVATYRLENEVSPQARDEVRAATHFYWTSASQYIAVREWLPDNAHHACGPGKTPRALSSAGLEDMTIFPSVKEWRAWLA
jgi:hydroxymethylbilane synthase